MLFGIIKRVNLSWLCLNEYFECKINRIKGKREEKIYVIKEIVKINLVEVESVVYLGL